MIKWVKLKQLLSEMEHPKVPVELSKGTVANDIELMIKTHSAMIENVGGRVSMPYYLRLLNYYKKYKNHDRENARS